MNVPKKYIGRLCEIIWKDPNSARSPVAHTKTGRAALATWREYGIIHDITDNVVLVAHSYAANPGESVVTNPDEMERTAVHEDFIEKITFFVPEGEAQT